MNEREWRSEDGSVLAVTALALLAIVGIAAFAIDLGMYVSARNEAQRAADASALAGAGHLIGVADEDEARATAQQYASRNVVHNDPVVLQDADVEVDVANFEVRTVVRRTVERGNPLPTVFGRVLGVDELELTADATARADGASAANCLLPVALPDKWKNFGSEQWDESEGDYYIAPPDRNATGYTRDDLGTQVQLRGFTGAASSFEPGWWYLWIPGAGPGAAHLDRYITDCPDPRVISENGDWVTDKNGNHVAIARAFEDLIAQDREAYWDESCGDHGCVRGGQGMSSPRVRGVPLFDPTTYTKTGPRSNFQISNFAGVFVEEVTNAPGGHKVVLARLIGLSGFDPTPGGSGSLIRVVRLVE